MIVEAMRYLPRAEDIERMPGAELRASFLVADLFAEGEFRIVPTELDRLVVGAVMPLVDMSLPRVEEFGTPAFLERRELGIINIGAPGEVAVNGDVYRVDPLDCLYIGMGEREVTFRPLGSEPPAFYFLSCPAHRSYPVCKVSVGELKPIVLGDEKRASRRQLYRMIHPAGIASCQLVMGVTELCPGSVWNTMPPHTHSRRSEVYLYFGLGDEAVIHLFGRPESTRHLIVRDRQAVLSPAWSMHAGAGTAPYRFIWGMAGENQEFDDMDAAPVTGLL
jgi:4-deoxy-L-threo-5-hexosulose-uronate ketol-isomerase